MNKHCKQQLEKFGIKAEDITHVCIAPNVYPLLQYLLLMEDDIVFRHTFFFINEIIPENVRAHLPNQCFNYFGKTIILKIHRRISKFRIRFFKYLDFPFLNKANLLAYDIPYLNLLIGKRDYSLLADGPNWMTLNLQEHSPEFNRQTQRAKSLKGRAQKSIFGDIFVNYYGRNNQCKTVHLTEENISPILKRKHVVISSLQELWEGASVTKQEHIKNMFNMSNKDIDLFNSRPIIYFTQPLINDCGLTESEWVEINRMILNHYDHNKVIIKTHPRDTFNYKKYFPNIEIYNKIVSAQLLSLVGVKPEKVVTICSTAIEAFPESIECDYYGTCAHPKIMNHLGAGYTARRKVNAMKSDDHC